MSKDNQLLSISAKTLRRRFDIFIVEGVDTAGKTTFCKNLKNLLGGANIIHAGGPSSQPIEGIQVEPIRPASNHDFRSNLPVEKQVNQLQYQHDLPGSVKPEIKRYCNMVTPMRREVENKLPASEALIDAHERTLYNQMHMATRSFDHPVILDRSYVGEAVYGALYRETMANPWMIHRKILNMEESVRYRIALINLTSDVTHDDGNTINLDMRDDEDKLFKTTINTFWGIPKARVSTTVETDYWRDFSDIIVEVCDRLI